LTPGPPRQIGKRLRAIATTVWAAHEAAITEVLRARLTELLGTHAPPRALRPCE
jgi:hypothetical protein